MKIYQLLLIWCLNVCVFSQNRSTNENVGLNLNSSVNENTTIVSLGPHGLVIVTKNERNGTVCNDEFDDNDAKVVCRMLGLPTEYARSLQLGRQGKGGPDLMDIALDEVQCTGSEENIEDCRHDPFWSSDCDHSEDIGVFCPSSNSEEGPPATATQGPKGLVIITKNGKNGTICNDKFGDNEAKVVCRMLGLPNNYSKIIDLGSEAINFSKAMDIALDEVHCTGTEDNIERCRHDLFWRSDCIHTEDVAVSCQLIEGPSDEDESCNIYRGRGYKFVNWEKKWTEALKTCLMSGATLTSVKNKFHNEWLTTTSQNISDVAWWIGISDIRKENKFTTVDGAAAKYVNWRRKEPNNAGNEDCVELGRFSPAIEWNDASCDNLENYICEYDTAACVGKPGHEEIYARNGKKYYFYRLSKTWHEARSICRLIGSHLVSVDDEEHMQWLAEKALDLENNWWWIGLNDISREGTFVWSDRSMSTYRNFASKTPYESLNNCVHFGYNRDAKWNDQSCQSTAYFICKS